MKLVRWPGGELVASLEGVKHQLERESLGFSPSGARLAIADGGYVTPPNRTLRVFATSDGSELARIKTDEFSFHQVAMLDDDTVVIRGLRHDFVFDSQTEPQHVLACYDVPSGRARWRLRRWSRDLVFALDLEQRWVWTSAEVPISPGVGVGRDLVALACDDGSEVATAVRG